MTLPPIPDEAQDAALFEWCRQSADTTAMLRSIAAAWPHLYAVALRHAADDLEHEDRCAPDECLCDISTLRGFADEATP